MAGDAGPGAGDIEYRVYANDGEGGPINLATPWATTRSANFVAGPTLTANASWSFLVRVYDRDLELLEDGTDARVDLVTDGDGNDITLRPRPVNVLTARPGASGELIVTWTYLWTRDARAADEFRVWAVASPGPIDFTATPSAAVSIQGGETTYQTTLTGLTAGTTYLVAVRAVNGTADDGSTATVTVAAGVSAATGDAPVGASGSS